MLNYETFPTHYEFFFSILSFFSTMRFFLNQLYNFDIIKSHRNLLKPMVENTTIKHLHSEEAVSMSIESRIRTMGMHEVRNSLFVIYA
jgi:hypothetical protein